MQQHKMQQQQSSEIGTTAARPFAILLLPLLAAPLLAACADSANRKEACERPATCGERRALPILY